MNVKYRVVKMMEETNGFFEPPRGWKWTFLEDCVDILDSMRVPVRKEERKQRCEGKKTSKLFPYYGATGQVGWIDGYLFNEELVLLGEDGAPFLDKEKEKAYIITGKSWVNNHAHVLRAISDLITPSYLCYYLNTVDYSKLVSGSTRLKLNQSKLRKIPVLLPPLETQKKIVSVLDKTGQLKLWRKEADRLTEDYLSSVFLEMFEKIEEKIQLNQLVTKITDYRGSTPPFSTEGIRCISAANVSKGKLVFDVEKRVSLETYKKTSTRGFPKPNDIIITTEAPVGEVALYPKNELFRLTRRVMALRINSDLASYIYVYHFLLSEFFKRQLPSKIRGSTVPRILKPDLLSIEVPNAPRDLQNKFADIATQIYSMTKFQEKSRNQIENLYNSLQNNVFMRKKEC